MNWGYKGCDTIECKICKKNNRYRDIQKIGDKRICVHCGANLDKDDKKAFSDVLMAKLIKCNCKEVHCERRKETNS